MNQNQTTKKNTSRRQFMSKTSKSNGGFLNRRDFIGSASAAALSFTIVGPSQIRSADANSKINLGMIGCGSRGTWLAKYFKEHGGYNITASADYFQEKVDRFSEAIGVDKANCYTGLSAYKKLLEQQGIEAVAIESPPYFHPEQAAAAIDAGKHVYLAKPIAVDVPGCTMVEDAGKKATSKNLCFIVDFQTRTDEIYQEAVKRVQYGDIGRLICGESVYQCGMTWGQMDQLLLDNPGNAEVRLKAWGRDRILSGDVITEQNIHALDVTCWILDKAPIMAYGTGGQRARKGGNCWDHFGVIFKFPDDILITFNSRQFGEGYDDIMCRVYGTKGIIDTHYFGNVCISGNNPYKGGIMENLYARGASNNITRFYEDITKGQFANTTVPASVRSNLTTILGRTAAYTKKEVTWDEMMNENKKLEADLRGLKA